MCRHMDDKTPLVFHRIPYPRANLYYSNIDDDVVSEKEGGSVSKDDSPNPVEDDVVSVKEGGWVSGGTMISSPPLPLPLEMLLQST